MRIASLSPAITEILFALELHDLIVCTDQFSNFPEEARDIPHVNGHQKIDVRELFDHEVDLVFTCTVIQEKLSETVKNADLSAVHFDPRTINSIYEMIRSIGLMMQVEDRAKQVILSMQQGLNDVKSKARLLPQKQRVYIEEWHNPPFASGNWVPEVARVAGLQQFPVKAGELSPEITLKQVQEFNPDFIVLSYCGAGDLVEKELLTSRVGWDQLRAVQQDRIRIIDDSLLNRPGPRLVEGAQRLFGWTFEDLH